MSDIHALSGAYAVDALDRPERVAFERHLATCAICRAEVDGLREASALLAETCPARPSAQLRERVLADAATHRPLPPLVAPVVELAARRRPRRATALLAAAAAVVAIGAGGVVVDQVRDEPVAVQLSAADRVLAAPDAETVGEPARIGRGKITVVRSRSLNQAVLVTQGLTANPTGTTRELWLKHGNEYIPAGYLGSGPDHRVLLAGDPSSAKAFGLTIEPASGSKDPSDKLVSLLDFSDAVAVSDTADA